jgi:hypothetical protein
MAERMDVKFTQAGCTKVANQQALRENHQKKRAGAR